MAYGFHVHPKEYTADVRGFSFVIERDGDLYRAYKSGKGLTFEDDDASTVIQGSIDNAPAHTCIQILGEVTISSTIKMKNHIGLRGGRINAYGLEKAISFENVAECWIYDLFLIGDRSTGSVGIDLSGSTYRVRLEEVEVRDFETGIKIDVTNGAITLSHVRSVNSTSRQIWVRGGTGVLMLLPDVEAGGLSDYSSVTGIEVGGGGTNPNYCTIILPWFEALGTGIKINSDAYFTRIVNPFFTSVDTHIVDEGHGTSYERAFSWSFNVNHIFKLNKGIQFDDGAGNINTILQNINGKGRLMNLEQYVDDYGGNFTNFTPPDLPDGSILLAKDTNATNPAQRLYLKIGGTWYYVGLS